MTKIRFELLKSISISRTILLKRCRSFALRSDGQFDEKMNKKGEEEETGELSNPFLSHPLSREIRFRGLLIFQSLCLDWPANWPANWFTVARPENRKGADRARERAEWRDGSFPAPLFGR